MDKVHVLSKFFFAKDVLSKIRIRMKSFVCDSISTMINDRLHVISLPDVQLAIITISFFHRILYYRHR
jgi:hypothetical protein